MRILLIIIVKLITIITEIAITLISDYLKMDTKNEVKFHVVYISWFKTIRLQFLFTFFSQSTTILKL